MTLESVLVQVVLQDAHEEHLFTASRPWPRNCPAYVPCKNAFRVFEYTSDATGEFVFFVTKVSVLDEFQTPHQFTLDLRDLLTVPTLIVATATQPFTPAEAQAA